MFAVGGGFVCLALGFQRGDQAEGGPAYEAHLEDDTLPIDGEAAFLVDAEVGYKVTENVELIAGAQNLLDQYPVDNPWAGIAGARYGERSPYGFNGGFYYLKARMTW